MRCVNGDTAAAVAGVNFFFRPIFKKFVTLSQLTRAPTHSRILQGQTVLTVISLIRHFDVFLNVDDDKISTQLSKLQTLMPHPKYDQQFY